MSLKYRPMAIMGFSALSVLFICAYFDDRFSFVAMALGITILLLSIVFKSLRQSIVPFFLAAALIISGASFEILSDYKISDASRLADREAEITATVLDEPDFTGTRYYYILKTQSINGEPFEVKLRLSASNYLTAEPYDTIQTRITLYEIGKDSRDIKLYYQSKGIFLGGYINNYDEVPLTVTGNKGKGIEYRLFKLRKTIESNILDKLPNDYGGVAVGMLTGNKEFISDEVYASIKSAGVAPVFAVSGMHLSVWVMGLYSLLEILNVRKRLNSLIGIAFVLLFMGLTGFTPSVCRAGIMLLTVLVGNLFYRRADSLNSLGLATLLLCIFNPMIVADIGFLLSFSSTLGIVLINPVLNKLFFGESSVSTAFAVVKLIAESVFVSVSATVGSLGFVIAFIGYISVYSVLSNLLISYAASICMLTGGLGALLIPIGGLGNGFLIASGCVARYIIFVIRKISELPFSTIDTYDIGWTIGIVFVYAIAISLYILRRRKPAFKLFCCATAFCVAVSSVFSFFLNSEYEVLTVLDTETSVNLVVSGSGHSAVVLSNNKYKYLSEGVSSALKDKCADIVLADTYFGGYQSVYLAIKQAEPRSLIVPSSEQALLSVCNEERIATAQNAEVILWSDTRAKFISEKSYSIFSCELQGVKLTAILRVAFDEAIPEEYLSGDILICRSVPEGANYGKTIICGEAENGIVSTDKYGELTVKIKNNKYKISANADN